MVLTITMDWNDCKSARGHGIKMEQSDGKITAFDISLIYLLLPIYTKTILNRKGRGNMRGCVLVRIISCSFTTLMVHLAILGKIIGPPTHFNLSYTCRLAMGTDCPVE